MTAKDEHLPLGWGWVSVGEMASAVQYGTSSKTNVDTSGVPVIRMGNIQEGLLLLDSLKYLPERHDEFPDLLLRDGDVLFNRTNSAELVGKTAVYRGNPSRASFASYLIRAQLKPNYVPEFLAYYINSPHGKRWVRSVVSQQVGQANVNGTKLKAFRVPIPTLLEQRRIVAEIEKQFTRLDAGIAALRRTQANLKRYRAAVLKAACEGRLVPTEAELARKEALFGGSISSGTKSVGSSPDRGAQMLRGKKAESSNLADPKLQSASGSTPSSVTNYETGEQLLARILTERRENWQRRGEYKAPAAPNVAELPKLPDGWTWARLEQLGVTYGGLTKNPKRAKLPKQLPYLRVANVYANQLRLEEIEYIGVADSELEKLLVRSGDLLIVEGNGSKDQIGRLAIWDGSIDSCVHQNHLIKVRAVESRTPKWILYWLQSRGGRKYVELVASSTSGLFTLSVNKVGNLPVPVPPLAEQTRIVAEVERRLSVVAELETVVTTNLQRAHRLRQSILQSAFKEEL